MSWIIGVLHDPRVDRSADALQHLCPPPLHILKAPGLLVLAGGIPETLFHAPAIGPDHHAWVVAGSGIRTADDGSTFLSVRAWGEIMSQRAPDLSSLDGHFAGLRCREDTVDCFVDQLGLRSLYFAVQEDVVFVSTRQEWVARAAGCSSPDLHALGPRWFAFNQITYDSSVRGVRRIGPGGWLTVRRGRIIGSVPFVPWTPVPVRQSFDDAIAPIIRLQADGRLSIGLSGGVDSRLLLSVALGERAGDFTTHTVGEEADPDLIISRAIVREVGTEQRIIPQTVPGPEEMIGLAEAYAERAHLVEPVSSVLKLRHFSLLRASGLWMMDGGFGEIARRQYLNRAGLAGRKALKRGDTERLMQHLLVTRGDIFLPEVARELRHGVLLQLRDMWDLMPGTGNSDPGNALDLLAVRTRFPNYGEPEQARLDDTVLNLMPFAQPSVLHALFATPISRRQQGRMIRNIIRKRTPALARFPFAKGGTTVPFFVPTIPAWLWIGIKRRILPVFRDTARDCLLSTLREYVRDLAASTQCRTSPLYAHDRITHALDRYYAGDHRYGGTVDWWLTFELWRQGLTRSGTAARR